MNFQYILSCKVIDQNWTKLGFVPENEYDAN